MTYALLLGAHALCVAIVLAAVLIGRRWLRPVAVGAGAVALWLPLFALFASLGAPNPYPPKGDYRLISSKMDETADLLYLFVDTYGRDFTPRLYRIPFEPEKYRKLREESDYDARALRIAGGEGGDFEVVYVDHVPPDLLKDGMMRGWEDPDPED